MPTNLYGLGVEDFLTGAVKSSDAWHCLLVTNTYVPNFDTDHFLNVAGCRTNEVVGAGYVTDGVAAALTAPSYVVASSATPWAVSGTTPTFAVGEIVRKIASNGHIYRCVVGGAPSATTEPVWPITPGATIVDNGVTWAECGRGYVKLAFTPAQVAWASATITARYLLVVDFTPVTDATRVLLACMDMRSAGVDPASTAGSFTVTFDTQGLLLLPIPS